MSLDESFSRALREHVDTVRPLIDVDTSHVISGARRRRTVRRSATAAVLLSAVLALALSFSTQPWTSWTSTPPVATPTVAPAPVQPVDPAATYWHTRSEIEVGGVVVERSEDWTARTGQGLSVRDGDLSQALPTEALRMLVRIDGTVTALTWDGLDEVPTDPAALEAFARAGLLDDSGEPDTAVLVLLVDLVRSPVTPELRSAAWTVASGLPGAVVTTAVTGSRGQVGTLLESSGNTYLFDPASGLLLEYTSRDARIVYLEQDITSELPAGAPTPRG